MDQGFSDIDLERVRAVASISTVEVTLGRVDELLELASACSAHRKTLTGCAVLLAAAGLEQAVVTGLTNAAENLAVEEDLDVCETPHYSVYESTIWHRIIRLPELLSHGTYRLRRTPTSRLLRELIQCRNRLMHVKETPVILDHENITISGDQFFVTVPMPESAWDSLEPEWARECLSAVRDYLRVVIFPEGGAIVEHRMLERLW